MNCGVLLAGRRDPVSSFDCVFLLEIAIGLGDSSTRVLGYINQVSYFAFNESD